jgi:hypothetical protein
MINPEPRKEWNFEKFNKVKNSGTWTFWPERREFYKSSFDQNILITYLEVSTNFHENRQ